MSSPAWWTKAVIYELYVDKFAGNFTGLTSKLGYFSDLGVDTIWILPHYPSPMVDDGYDISDYEGIRPELGTMGDFDRFVTEANSQGLKVMIDMVLNHTSDKHPWFLEAASSKDNPKRNWYLWNNDQARFPEAYVHFQEVKTNNWIYNQKTGDYYYATFYPQQPDLNWDNPEVMAAMLGVIDFWLRKGVNGLRLDAVSRLVKRNGTNCFALPETHQVIKQIRAHIDSQFPGVIMMAESGGWPDEARPFFGAGDECQLVINFPLAARLLSSISTKYLPNTADLLSPIPDNCRWAVFLTNHDSVDLMFLTDENEKQTLRNKVDPSGNFTSPTSSGFSARLAEICQGNKEDIIWATRELLSQPGTPIIYYGNELGMRNQSLTPKTQDTRIYVRGQFDWEEVDRQKSDPNSVFNAVRTLIRNR